MSPKTRSFLLKHLFVLSINVQFIDAKNLVSSDEGEHVTYLPANEAQKEYLADNVCRDSFGIFFDYNDDAIDKCKEKFGWRLDDADQEPGLLERCRVASGSSSVTVTLEVPVYNHYQILLLLPDPNDHSAIIYNIVNKNSKYTDGLAVDVGKNYTIYSTRLDDTLTPVSWRRGGSILDWNLPAKKIYDVQANYNITGDSIDGWLTWNQTGRLDACFELDISCYERSFSKNIWPDSPPGVVIKSLPPNEFCNIKLRGLYGTTETNINTPAYKGPDETFSVEIPSDPSYDKSPDGASVENVPYKEALEIVAHEASLTTTEKPNVSWAEDIRTTAEEDGEKWTVHVAWSKPLVIPDIYNVTMLGQDVFSIVPGNATKADLKGVVGSGFYNVSVYAILGNKRAHNSAQGIFLRSMERGTGAGVVRWAVAAGAAWAAAVLAAILYWFRSCRANIVPHVMPKLSTEVKLKEPPLEDIVVEPPPTVDAWEIKPERLTLHEVIGEGAFGVVRRGTLAPSGKGVAVKMLKDFPSLEEMRAFHLEMELMKSVGAHPHVVSLVGCCSTRQPAIVAEYCSRGDLLNFLRCSWDVMVSKRNANYYNNNINTSEYRNDLFKRTMPQEHSRLVVNKMYDLQGVCDTELTSLDLLSFCRQIAMGMEFLSLNKVVHRDLAARNILVTGDKTLKIADFGLSRDVYEENQYKQKGNGKMPVKWMALESLTRRIYTTQSDVWSFGVVVWEVVTVGGAPYAGVDAARLPRLLRAGYRMPRPPNCSHHLYELMRACWAARPRDRPTFAQLHALLDELLNSASADEYLSLELDDEPPPTSHHHRYFRMILRAKRSWTRGESYERPLKAPNNHYTTPPVSYKTPV